MFVIKECPECNSEYEVEEGTVIHICYYCGYRGEIPTIKKEVIRKKKNFIVKRKESRCQKK